jgi:hypothetical protein
MILEEENARSGSPIFSASGEVLMVGSIIICVCEREIYDGEKAHQREKRASLTLF